MSAGREDFLIAQYNQLMGSINRHLTVIWQSLTALIGSFTIHTLVEKNVISMDIAVSLGVLVAIWSVCHIIDAGYWYNHNLVIIANIERQFMTASDAREIHYYFTGYRQSNEMIVHLKIQMGLAISILAAVIVFHFMDRVFPGFSAPISNFDLKRSFPYMCLGSGFLIVWLLYSKRSKDYNELIERSPGKVIK